MALAMNRLRDLLIVRANGFHTPGPVAQVIASIRAEMDRQGLTRLLLDLRGLAGLVAPNDHLEDARSMVEQMQGIRWATLVRREQYSGTGRAFCLEHGCDMDTFFDERAAIAWLEAGPGPAP